MKKGNNTIKLRKLMALLLVTAIITSLFAFNPVTTFAAYGDLTVENMSWQKNIPGDTAFTGDTVTWPENSAAHVGGVMYVLIKNNTASAITPNTFNINGQSIASLKTSAKVNWYRMQPATIPAGDVGTLIFQTGKSGVSGSNYFTEGNNVTVQVGYNSVVTGELTKAATTPTLRMGTFQAASAMNSAILILRNDNASLSYTINNITVNNLVTGYTFSGNGVLAAKASEIATLNFSRALTINEPLAITVTATDSSSNQVKINATLKVQKPEFNIGAWGNSISGSERERAKYMGQNTSVDGGDSGNIGNQANYEYKGISFIADPLDILNNNTNVGNFSLNQTNTRLKMYKIMDEPDNNTSTYTSTKMSDAYDKFLTLDPNHSSFINLARLNHINEYTPLADVAGVDHYELQAPLAYTPSNANRRLAEVYWFANHVKLTNEPRQTVNWSQGAASTWGDAKNIRIPFWLIRQEAWLNLMSGAKGLNWFDNAVDYADKTILANSKLAMAQVNSEINSINNVLSYADKYNKVTSNNSKVGTYALVSKDAVVVMATNYNSVFGTDGISYKKVTLTAITGATTTVTLPSWLSAGSCEIFELWGTNKNTASYTVNGSDVTFSYGLDAGDTLNVSGASNYKAPNSTRIFVIRKTDTTAPSTPTGFKSYDSQYKTGFKAYVWPESTDNIGVSGYNVYKNGTLLEFVKGAGCFISNTDLIADNKFTVKAVDLNGNLSSEAIIPNKAIIEFRFNKASYTAGETATMTVYIKNGENQLTSGYLGDNGFRCYFDSSLLTPAIGTKPIGYHNKLYAPGNTSWVYDPDGTTRDMYIYDNNGNGNYSLGLIGLGDRQYRELYEISFTVAQNFTVAASQFGLADGNFCEEFNRDWRPLNDASRYELRVTNGAKEVF